MIRKGPIISLGKTKEVINLYNLLLTFSELYIIAMSVQPLTKPLKVDHNTTTFTKTLQLSVSLTNISIVFFMFVLCDMHKHGFKLLIGAQRHEHCQIPGSIIQFQLGHDREHAVGL